MAGGLTSLADHGFEAAGALLVALLVLSLRQKHPRTYLSLWLIAATGGFVAAVAGGLLAIDDSPASGARFFLSLTLLAGGYAQAGWMALACRDLAGLRPFTLRQTRTGAAILAAVVVVHAFALLPVSRPLRGIFEEGLLDILAAASSFAGGWWMWRRRVRRESAPFAIFSLALWAYGGLQIARVTALIMARGGDISVRFGIADLVLQGATALVIAISLLEDEREAAVDAAAQVEHIAYHDLLTGLPNRALFFDRLLVAMAHTNRYPLHRIAILFFDLDRFKIINDSLGHTVGDALLKAVSERIRGVLRNEDTLARIGGDEFVILTQINGKIEDAGKIARKTLDAINLPFQIANREIVVTSSIGIAVYPNDGPDAETLVKNADTAMYRAKEQGRDNYQYYTPAMNARAIEMLEIESDLRRAIVRDELRLHYQPLVDVGGDHVFGVEALLRWQHPERGLLQPEAFIGMAESSGLIVPIGNWVLREACRQAKTWHRQFGIELIVCVNLSPRQFQHCELADQVRAALNDSGLRPKYLELEITETDAMKDVDTTIRVLRELKTLGVRIAIDDFGTGYSSLSYLRQFPVDTLKLDQSFVAEITVPEDGAIASGVIAMAHSLQLKVLAEGVETLGQLDFLKTHACDRLQGFLFSRPLTPPMFEKYVAHRGRSVHPVSQTSQLRVAPGA
ncbi:MAG: putative bifunctional diguanylate cyclase/phosphodiesterase [Thermoanaerobaculia bacterium]